MKKTLFITRAALIAAFYVILGLLSKTLGLDSGIVQLRLSEALCVLPVFSAVYAFGVTVGCFVFNLFSGNIFDIVFGTLATLIGAIFASLFKKRKYLAFIPTVISNSVIIPLVIYFGTMNGHGAVLPIIIMSVALGETVSCGVLGNLLLHELDKRNIL